MPILNDFENELQENVPIDLILKMVGYQNSKMISPEILADTAKMISLAQKTAEPVVIYQETGFQINGDDIILENGECFQSKSLKNKINDCDGIVIALMTLGEGLQKEVSEILARDILNGYILDTASSYLVERLSEILWQRLTTDYNQLGYRTTSFISPGVKDFTLDKQRVIFEILDPVEIGVKLTTSYAIEPGKSLTVIMGYGTNNKQARESHNCADCDMKECLLRGIHGEI